MPCPFPNPRPPRALPHPRFRRRMRPRTGFEAAATPELRGETIVHQTVSEEAAMAAEFEELHAAMDTA